MKNSRTPSLETIQNVGIEIARIYRRTKRGELETPDGYRLVQMLAVLRDGLEQRLTELEAQVARGTPVPPWKPKSGVEKRNCGS